MNYKFLERHKKTSFARDNEKNPVNTAQKKASKTSTKQDEEATTEEMPESIVLYTERIKKWPIVPDQPFQTKVLSNW